ncbi:MAG: SMC-Scp complex subunit ScpB [Acidobacteriia bacterium]|nr:SMC-Scp complex subunit ScpB [Terriglobia bacterium]
MRERETNPIRQSPTGKPELEREEIMTEQELKSVVEAIVYIAAEPVPLKTLRDLFPNEPTEKIAAVVGELTAEYQAPHHGIEIREVAHGLKMSTKPEHYDILKQFARAQRPPTRLSLSALETLACIAYKQPVTLPEIQQIRGVNASSVIHTLLERKLITAAGRKAVVGRPILYRTTKEFLVHFGLKDLSELPTLKEFEEIASHGSFSADAASLGSSKGIPDPSGTVGFADPSAESIQVLDDPAEDGPTY